jgi:hypothetical protein
MGQSTEIIDDLVVLGRAGPEVIEEDGRHTVCLGGWSESKGFVRLYPTHKYSNANRWNTIKVPVVSDDSHDSRDESYKIQGSKEDWDILHEKIEKVGELDRQEQMELTKQLPKTCRHTLNEKRKSLGIVEPKQIHDAYLEEVENPEPIHTDLQGNQFKSKGSYPHKLYIEYTCEGCEAKTNHRQHCIEWGIYRFWDKNPDYDPEKVIDALKLRDDDYKKYFFIGNLANHRTAYIVISVFRWKKDELFQSTFDSY